MRYWHEVLPNRFSIADRFGHRYVARSAPPNFVRTLEIGVGLGEHLAYEDLLPAQLANYYGLDIRQSMLDRLRETYPGVNALVGDCQQPQPFESGYFDRIIAIHVLEHLSNLPATVREMHRLCDPFKGMVQVVIPCEGSLAYRVARRISAQRIFEKRYRQPYHWFYSRTHQPASRDPGRTRSLLLDFPPNSFPYGAAISILQPLHCIQSQAQARCERDFGRRASLQRGVIAQISCSAT